MITTRVVLPTLLFVLLALACFGQNGFPAGVPDTAIAVNSGWQIFSWIGAGPVFNDGGAYTFTSTGTTQLTVLDVSCRGDRFEVYDFGTLVGTTTAVSVDLSCNNSVDTPEGALVDPTYSRGVFALGPGAHAITIRVIVNPFTFGGAFLRIDAAATPDYYQVRYLSNLNIADSFINIVNVGTINGNDPAGRMCANIYTFDPNEEPVSCCACPITPNGLVSLSAVSTLTSNPLTFNTPSSVVVKILFTSNTTGSCDAGALPTPTPLPGSFPVNFAGLNLARGGAAWATTMHGYTPNGQINPSSYTITEGRFENSDLSPSEYFKLVSICNFIETYASRFGVCKGCQHLGRGAEKQ